MYAVLAGRIGLHAWRHEMEDTCFRLLYPRFAVSLERQFEAYRPVDMLCLRHTAGFLQRALRKHEIPSSLVSRVKSLYSTYRKMLLKRRAFHELTDRLALRIVVPSLDDCYRALGVIHTVMHPIPGKLKDYIGAPKENGYRSIHTVVYPLPGVTDRPIEIQIRTAAMDRECEYGVAAHGEYKNMRYALHSRASRVHLFRNLESLRAEARSPAAFATALRTYFRGDHLVLFDAQDRVYRLRRPATALDFVCTTSPDRIARLKAVRINGRGQSFDTLLADGDVVEAMFGRTIAAHPRWKRDCRLRYSRDLLRKYL